ncbi:MAG: DUF3108 domain-containing protein [Pyrinomonadaceae bacterium]|nr:DUF3108 domain-containing protein [Pyrinomonadaceae bacterium]
MNRSRNLLIAILWLATVGAGFANAQKSVHANSERPFEPGEELVYEAEFSRALLRKVDVADFRFTASRTPSNESNKNSHSTAPQKTPTYSLVFKGDVSSKGFFAKLFNLRFRERMESTVDPISFGVQNTKRVDEQGKRIRSSEAVFNHVAGKVVWTETEPGNPSRPPRTVSSPFTGPVQDILSAIYYLRTQPLQVGKTLELVISDSGQVYRIPIRVVEKKRMNTVLGKVNAVRLEVGLFGPRGMIDSEGQFSIWFTEDARRLPVSARVKSEIGTFDIKLKKVLRNSSQIQSAQGGLRMPGENLGGGAGPAVVEVEYLSRQQ